MQTINFELSKRLNNLGLLDNIETEYYINIQGNIIMEEEYFNFLDYSSSVGKPYGTEIEKFYKTLTLEEAIEFLPKEIGIDKDYFGNAPIARICLFWDKEYKQWSCGYEIEESELLVNNNGDVFIFRDDTLLEAIEQMIEYLLDNNLLINLK